jgi:hypothetical protein
MPLAEYAAVDQRRDERLVETTLNAADEQRIHSFGAIGRELRSTV